jgi:hypothetical protein
MECLGLSNSLVRQLASEAYNQKKIAEERFLDYANIVVAAFAALIALGALFQSILSDRRSRVANERSIRNETALGFLRKGDHP